MNDISIQNAASMPPLPPELAAALTPSREQLPKRDRTRRQLLGAAIRAFGTRGIAGATMQDIAALAEVAPGTVYNHFRTKDEIVREVALWIADTLCRRIAASCRQVPEGAERMAIGNRRYLWLAEKSPPWALLLLEAMAAAPHLLLEIRGYALADLRLGVRQKAFRVVSEAAAVDMIQGTVGQAMRSVASGQAPARHDVAIAASVLCGLGLPFDSALEVARRPLPPLLPEEGVPDTRASTASRSPGRRTRSVRGR